MLFGQSMGAYAAGQAIEYIDADFILSIASQFTVDKIKVSFDPGWQSYVLTNIERFIWDTPTKNNLNTPIPLAYDPAIESDSRDAHLIKSHWHKVHILPLTFCGHPPTRKFYRIGIELHPVNKGIL